MYSRRCNQAFSLLKVESGRKDRETYRLYSNIISVRDASTVFMTPQGGHLVIALSDRLFVCMSVCQLARPSVRHQKLVRSVTPTCLNGMRNSLVQMFTPMTMCRVKDPGSYLKGQGNKLESTVKNGYILSCPGYNSIMMD